MMRPILFLAAAALAGCATDDSVPAGSERPEAVYAAVAGKTALRLRVSSNGCTQKEDFRVERQGAEILFRRIKPDECRSFAIGSVWLEFGYAELGLGRADFRLANPLTPWRGPGD